ncbi:hypothetical protein EBB79_08495 [Parasedimentitalea marina]|uniref:Uncharacterized protein n=1 Tax=Parasedimentitalea marina TaxID=2483033 RepID=A0A3T0N1N3_9RHOB|nr:hypothetical protein [Parasedimentitalea marina]AZV77930.1 hypothetical protein EBB79_08495 [Parasedimentitalea marina]
MALQWPLTTSQFLDTLPVAKVTFRLARAQTQSETGGGDVIANKRGARLWQGQIVLDKDYHSVWAAIEARIALLEEPGASFLLRDIRLPGPIADPDKSGLGAATPTISDLNTNNREFSLTGAPALYKVSQGDLLGFTYGSNPTRYAVHRVVSDAIANLAGTISNIEVIPFIRPGAEAGAAVTLGDPVLRAKILEAEYGASRSIVSEGGVINWTQTLR